MKIAFDEHISPVIVKIFRILSEDGDILKAEFVSARDFVLRHKEGDIPWLLRFSESGGTAIISGDRNMRSRIHERLALKEAGLSAFFFTSAWNQKNRFAKTALLIVWWPKIEEQLRSLQGPQFWEIPCQWHVSSLKNVTGP